MNPFPVLASGSRWVLPAGNSLGAGILDGQGFTYYPRDYSPTWEQRYSLGHPARVARQPPHRGLLQRRVRKPAHEQATSAPCRRSTGISPTATAPTTDNAMKATVANPFLAALPAIQASNPALYNYLSNVGMFTGDHLAGAATAARLSQRRIRIERRTAAFAARTSITKCA